MEGRSCSRLALVGEGGREREKTPVASHTPHDPRRALGAARTSPHAGCGTLRATKREPHIFRRSRIPQPPTARPVAEKMHAHHTSAPPMPKLRRNATLVHSPGTRACFAPRGSLQPTKTESRVCKENACTGHPSQAWHPNKGAHATPAAHRCQNCTAMLRWHLRLHTRA